jgi:hypothetical protein
VKVFYTFFLLVRNLVSHLNVTQQIEGV